MNKNREHQIFVSNHCAHISTTSMSYTIMRKPVHMRTNERLYTFTHTHTHIRTYIHIPILKWLRRTRMLELTT